MDEGDLAALRQLVKELTQLGNAGNPANDATFQLNWNLKVAEWRGRTLAALEAVNNSLAQIRSDTNKNRDSISELREEFHASEMRQQERLSKAQVKLAAIAATVTILLTLVLNYVLK